MALFSYLLKRDEINACKHGTPVSAPLPEDEA
jgi:hypothetical protein